MCRKKLKSQGHFKYELSGSSTHGLPAEILRTLQSPLTKSRISRIEKLIDRLEELGHVNEDRIFWLNYLLLKDESPPVGAIGLSLHRGMAGIIAALSLCYQLGIKRRQCLKLLEGAVKQVLLIDKMTGCSELPSYWGNPKISNIRRTTLCYGDVAVGYALTLAGLRCQKRAWINHGKKIFKRGIRRSAKEANIIVPYFSDGACGLSHMAYRFYQLTKDRSVLSEVKRWRTIADHLHEKSENEQKLIKIPGKKITPASLHNSALGFYLVKWFQDGLIDARWDSMYGLSNPITGNIV
jgi:hypothetical protein